MNEKASNDGIQTDWIVVLSALGLGILGALYLGKVSAALPHIQKDLNQDLIGGGFVMSIFSLLGAVLGFFIGGVTKSFGSRMSAQLGCGMLALGSMIGAFSHDMGMMLVSRAIEGVGYIIIVVTMPGIIAGTAAKRDRSLALGIWSVFVPVGFASALLLMPLSLEFGSWRNAWWILSAVTLLAIFLLGPKLPKSVSAKARDTKQSAAKVLGSLPLWCLAIAFGAYAFQWIALMTWLPTFFSGSLGSTIQQAALFTALVVAINIPGNLVAGFLLRAGLPPFLLILAGVSTMALTSTFLFLGGSDISPQIGLILCLAFSCMAGMVPTVLFAEVPFALPSPAYSNLGNGMLVQGSAIGQFIGPPLVAASVAATRTDWSGALWPMLIAAFVTIALGYIAIRTRP